MKKRIRRKKHVGEFAEFGRQFVVRRNRKDDLEEFLDWVVDDVVEGNDCFCGGGGKDEQIDIIIELGRRDQGREDKRNRIERMLRKHPDVTEVLIGEEFDLWHGDYNDILDSRDFEQDGAGQPDNHPENPKNQPD